MSKVREMGECSKRQNCYHCHEPGHRAFQCPKKNIEREPREPELKEVTCFECDKKGHYRPDCPTLKTNPDDEAKLAKPAAIKKDMLVRRAVAAEQKEENEKISAVSEEKTPAKSNIVLGRIDGIIVIFLLDSGGTLVQENLT